MRRIRCFDVFVVLSFFGISIICIRHGIVNACVLSPLYICYIIRVCVYQTCSLSAYLDTRESSTYMTLLLRIIARSKRAIESFSELLLVRQRPQHSEVRRRMHIGSDTANSFFRFQTPDPSTSIGYKEQLFSVRFRCRYQHMTVQIERNVPRIV